MRKRVSAIFSIITQKIKTGRTAHKTLFIQILCVVFAFGLMVLLGCIFMANIVRQNLVRNANGVLDVAETRITSHLSEFEVALASFADETRAMLARGETAGALRDYIGDISRFTFLDGGETSGIQSFYGYFEALPGGPELITGGVSSEFTPAATEVGSPSESEWYAMAGEAAGGVVETVPRVVDAENIMYTYAQSIYDGDGRRLGVVCMDVRVDVIGREVVNTALTQGGYGMLMNQELTTMFHPNPAFVGVNVDDPLIPVYIFADELRAGQEIFERPLTSYKNESSVAFFRRLPNGWYLGLVTPDDQYYAGMDSMAITLGVLGCIFAFVLVVMLISIDKARLKSDDENKKKSMFLANMSHEIRTPINAIVGMTAIGRAAGTTERKDYCFMKIDGASKHLLGVVNDILDMSKIEANKIELSPTDFNFEKMLQQAVSVANFRADEKRQKLTVHIDKAIPRILYADDQRLAQIITNLLGNAVKFTPDEGAIALKTAFLGEEGGECRLRIDVSDNGIGMSPEQQSKLFRSFQQAESSTTRKYGGTGLGLAISKSIVEMMGGEIWAESELGAGTTMSFTVKARRGAESPFELSRQGVSWENVRILTVDDDPDILLYFQDIVSGFGASCDVAKSAEEALLLVDRNGTYNIYFIDLRMPNVDGITLTKEIRARERDPENSVVIMISSADLGAVEQDAKKAGVNKFLLKPLFPSSISDVISECIGIVNEKAEEEPQEVDGIFEGRRILFAEDVEINREIVVSLLEPTRLAIECAENGVEAVAMFAADPAKYDMIFMDIQMPEMDGYEATRQIRALDCARAGTVPIVAMTANVFREDIENCLAAGMNGHLGKPLDMDDVFRQLRRYLGAGGNDMGGPPDKGTDRRAS